MCIRDSASSLLAAPDPSATEADSSRDLASNNRMYLPGSIVPTIGPLGPAWFPVPILLAFLRGDRIEGRQALFHLFAAAFRALDFALLELGNRQQHGEFHLAG